MRLRLCILLSFLPIAFCFAQDGFPDPHFGVDGFLDLSTPNVLHFTSSSVRKPNGQILHTRIENDTTYPNFKAIIQVLQLMPNGSPDLSYGINGKVEFPVDSLSDLADTRLDPTTGDLLIAMDVYDTLSQQSNFMITRIRQFGQVDTSFGINGFSVIDFGNSDRPQSIDVQNDGKIAVGGIRVLSPSNSDYEIAICRLNPNGTLDSAFGIDGKVIYNPFINTTIADLRCLDDGSIIFSGSGEFPNLNPSFYLTISKLNHEGSPDSTFGFAGTNFLTLPGDDNTYGGPIDLTRDGNIIVGGAWSANALVPILACFDSSTGSLINSFGNQGIAVLDSFSIEPIPQFEDIEVQPDGKILCLGIQYRLGDNYLALARFDSTGVLDSAEFGIGGKTLTGLGADGDMLSPELLPIDNDSFLVAGSYYNFGQVNYGTFISKFSEKMISGDLGLFREQPGLVYPNPFTSHIRLRVTEQDQSIQQIEVFSLDGKKLLSITEQQTENEILDLSSLESGMYLVQIRTDREVFREKVIKQ